MNWLKLAWHCFRLSSRFQVYEPRPITPRLVWQYLSQFEPEHRLAAIDLLDNVKFLSRKEALERLSTKLKEATDELISAGVSPASIFVVPASKDGTSSAEVFEELEAMALGLGQVSFFQGNALQLKSALRGVPDPVVIFVDDFAGTGKQFSGSHSAWSGAIQHLNPTTYFLACVMCTPAIEAVTGIGVIPLPCIEHTTSEMFKAVCKASLSFEDQCHMMSYAKEIQNKFPLGFDHLGSMYVMYRNSSNNMSFLLRGTHGQRVWLGLFPRRDQLKPSLI